MVDSRRKGQRGEREFSRYCEERMGLPAGTLRRNLQQSRSGGHDIIGLPGYAVEVKRRKGTPTDKMLDLFWEQTTRQATDDGSLPLLAWRPDRGRWRCRSLIAIGGRNIAVDMYLDDFIAFSMPSTAETQ